ncbi:hypothetical protein AAIR98_001032 [Elusimicrobium simillimum]|uniref:hypothetical protein n=1 Tax=Elusimicrobium simillimum TaxID=3143438 RepID=UPI003C6F7E9E
MKKLLTIIIAMCCAAGLSAQSASLKNDSVKIAGKKKALLGKQQQLNAAQARLNKELEALNKNINAVDNEIENLKAAENKNKTALEQSRQAALVNKQIEIFKKDLEKMDAYTFTQKYYYSYIGRITENYLHKAAIAIVEKEVVSTGSFGAVYEKYKYNPGMLAALFDYYLKTMWGYEDDFSMLKYSHIDFPYILLEYNHINAQRVVYEELSAFALPQLNKMNQTLGFYDGGVDSDYSIEVFGFYTLAVGLPHYTRLKQNAHYVQDSVLKHMIHMLERDYVDSRIGEYAAAVVKHLKASDHIGAVKLSALVDAFEKYEKGKQGKLSNNAKKLKNELVKYKLLNY